MNNFISLAIGQLEEELKEIRKQADAAELNLDTIKSVRKNIVDRVTELSQEYTRRASAIDKYNLEVEKIVKYGKRAMELARNPLPMQLSHVPAIKKSVKGVKEIHAIVFNIIIFHHIYTKEVKVKNIFNFFKIFELICEKQSIRHFNKKNISI